MAKYVNVSNNDHCLLTKVNIMSNINDPFVNDGGRFEVVFMSLVSSRYQLRLSILGLLTFAFHRLTITFAFILSC